ncbi:DUF2357 domain-containing protein [Sulfobacillus harzensis]|uniref:DUF2357 domain-containing protein n=1 Tax=Sulfobacillus harzensis TaxID=2729629 RepID=A0A7Y0L5Q4_9FIRM|nr:DUF2357 domain-containing protein [Sulfobacillus harzensis]NMP23772.1 DUF2357 domain-containing protein [Sulfobacillus harzensis]
MPHTSEILLRVKTPTAQFVILGPIVQALEGVVATGGSQSAYPVHEATIEPVDGTQLYDDVPYQMQITAASPTLITRGGRVMNVQWVSHSSTWVATVDLQFRQVGWVELCVGSHGVRVRVLSRKLDFDSDYRTMVDDLENQIRGLTARLISHVVYPMGLSDEAQDLWSYWLALMEKLWADLSHDLLHAWETLPPYLMRQEYVMELGRLKQHRPRDIRNLIRGKSRALVNLRRWESLTPERIYLLQLVSDVQTRLQRIQSSTSEVTTHVRLKAIVEQSRQLSRRLLAEAGLERAMGLPKIPHSPLAQSHPALGRVVRWHRLLQRGLFPNGESYFVGPKNVSLLYEYWCYLTIVRLVADESGGTLVVKPMASVNPRDIALGAGRGAAAQIDLRDGRSIHILYQGLFRGLPTVAQQPDHVVQIKGLGALTVFDAKYRFELDETVQRSYGQGIPIPPVDTINNMHQYHDAIVVTHPPYRRLVDRAIVLFPLPRHYSRDWREHRFYKSIEAVGVGALPLVPGGSEEYLREEIRRYLWRGGM